MLEKIEYQGKIIYLIGSAHISAESVREVESVIEEYRPDTVCVEICATRYHVMNHPEEWKKTDIVKTIKERKSAVLFSSMLLSAYQRKMGKDLGVAPGSEMRKAVELAEAKGLNLVLADREVRTTVKRITQSLSLWAKMRLASELFFSLFSNEKLEEHEIENMLEKDMVSSMVDELGKHYPALRRVLIDERDSYMAKKIGDAEGEVIVAVVGAGHLEGIKKKMGADADLKKLCEVKEKTGLSKPIKWLISIAIFGLIFYGFLQGDREVTQSVLIAWILANGIPSAIGGILAGAHPGTIFVAFFGSPVTSVNPMIGIGPISALTEAWLKKPKVKDFEEIFDAFSGVMSFRRNGVTRIFLVMGLTSLGSTLGTIFGVSYILNIFYS